MKHNLQVETEVATMSSREIAELTGSRHDYVKRTIDRLVAKKLVKAETSHESAGAREIDVYAVNECDSLVVVTQLCPELTAALGDRWQELEAAQARPALPLSFSRAPRSAADQQELIERQAAEMVKELKAKKQALAQVIETARKLEFFYRYLDSSGLKNIRQVCELLDVKEIEFRKFLQAKRVIYRLGDKWTPYKVHMRTDRLVVKGYMTDCGRASQEAKFTPKGLKWIAQLWAAYQREVAE